MLRAVAPILPRGIIAQKRRRAERDGGSRNHRLTHLRRAAAARPQFIAYAVNDLPAAVPLLLRNVFGLPLLAWTVRNAKERQIAQRWADQMIFEGFRPQA